MFTGLIEEQGQIVQLERGALHRITLATVCVHQDAKLGDSIAVNGCCLTIVNIDSQRMAFEAVKETVSRTNLGSLEVDDLVNLERSIKVGDRLGGHFVTGHVDAVGTIARVVEEEGGSKVWIRVPAELTPQMASKGSVAVDGVSLTLVDVDDSQFSVALIPHTLESTTLGRASPGDLVNIETDLLAKYVQRSASGGIPISQPN